MNTISPVIPTPVLAQPVLAVQAAPEGRQYDLQPYQMVQATVAEGGQDKVLLEFGEHRLWAETPIALQSGQRLQFRVLQIHPRLRLQIIEDHLSDYLVRSLHVLDTREEWLPVLTQLESEFPFVAGDGREETAWLSQLMALFSSPETFLNGDSLRTLSRRLGLSLEREFAQGGAEATDSLKGTLLRALAGDRQKTDAGAASAHDDRRGLLQALEMYQLCRVRFDQLGCIFLPLPLPFLEQGYLLAERKPPSDEEERPSHSLSLYLQLKNLGNLQINLLYDEDGLFLRFLCGTSRTAEFVASFRDELEGMLASVLPVKGLSFAEGAPAPTQILAQKLLKDARGVINERI